MILLFETTKNNSDLPLQISLSTLYIRKPITQFHKQLNNNGHKLIPNSGPLFDHKGNFDYIKGIFLARGVFLLGKNVKSSSMSKFPNLVPVKKLLRSIWDPFDESLNYGDYDYWSGIDLNLNTFKDDRTNIWSMKKKMWIRGPSLLTYKETANIYKDYNTTSIVSLNRTTFLIAGGDIENPHCFPVQSGHSNVTM